LKIGIIACVLCVALCASVDGAKSSGARKHSSKSSPTPRKKPPAESLEPSPTAASTPTATPTPSPSPRKSPSSEANAAISSDELVGYDKNPERDRELIESALELTRQNLTYTYGSADPANGGMDCSGFVYYILKKNGFDDAPRQSNEQYVWLRKLGTFRAVLSNQDDSFELDELRPGDLLFWIGTYNIDRDPPITHSMIYLGREKGSKNRVMVGSSDGRTYEGKSRWGVSVFDFKISKGDKRSFIGYAHLPGLEP
jgi:cell wall-associated NlpC family hydrolase